MVCCACVSSLPHSHHKLLIYGPRAGTAVCVWVLCLWVFGHMHIACALRWKMVGRDAFGPNEKTKSVKHFNLIGYTPALWSARKDVDYLLTGLIVCQISVFASTSSSFYFLCVTGSLCRWWIPPFGCAFSRGKQSVQILSSRLRQY